MLLINTMQIFALYCLEDKFEEKVPESEKLFSVYIPSL